MSTPVRVSVVIPAYNEAACLPACLAALSTQTVKPYEIIVVDNASTDGTRRIASQYDFVKVVNESIRGRVFARNRGFNMAKGSILARLDADAIVSPGWIEWITDYYTQDHRTTALTGGAHFYNMRPSRLTSWVYNFFVFRFNTLITGQQTLWGSNMALPRSLWNQVKSNVCEDNALHEDLDLAIHIQRCGSVIHYDSAQRVRVEMRRIHTDRQALWPYLLMWPRTLRRHGNRSWLVCWIVGVPFLYVILLIPALLEKIAVMFGQTPIDGRYV